MATTLDHLPSNLDGGDLRDALVDHFGARCILLCPLCMTGALFSPGDESVTTAKMVTPFLSVSAQRAQREQAVAII